MNVYREEVFFKVWRCILYVSHWNFTGIVIQGKKLPKVDFFVLFCAGHFICMFYAILWVMKHKEVFSFKKKKKCMWGGKKKSPLLNPVIDLLGHLCFSSLLSRIICQINKGKGVTFHPLIINFAWSKGIVALETCTWTGLDSDAQHYLYSFNKQQLASSINIFTCFCLSISVTT